MTSSTGNELRAQLPTHALHSRDTTGPLSGTLGLPTQTETSMRPRQQNPKIRRQENEIRKQKKQKTENRKQKTDARFLVRQHLLPLKMRSTVSASSPSLL